MKLTYLCPAPVSPLSYRRMKSDLRKVRECPAKRKKQEKEVNFILQSKEITLQIRARVMYLGASSDSWSVKMSSSSSFSSSCVTVSQSPWMISESLLLPSLLSSYKYRSNPQQKAHKISILKKTAWNPMCVLTLQHTEDPHPLFTSKVGPFCLAPQLQRTIGGVWYDFKGKGGVGFKLEWMSG